MGIFYAAVGFAAVPGVLMLFHRLSRTPTTVADEAEQWLLNDRHDQGR